jgi:uncharacterized membrane protein
MLSYTTIYYQILSMFISLIIFRLYHHILYYTISLYLGYWLIGTSGTALSKAEWPQKGYVEGFMKTSTIIYHSTMGTHGKPGYEWL